MNMKAEEVSDAEEEKNPVPKRVQEIKAEPEVSCVSLYVPCLANITDLQKCQLPF
jgi:hypothetical protein